MRSAELAHGRVFVLRLEDGEVLHEAVESFCRDNGILRATVSLTGAVDRGSVMVSGPTVPIEGKVVPLTLTLEDPCELTGAGTVFPDGDGVPKAHLHGSVGRKGFSATGDLRPRTVVWLVMEAVITELLGEGPVRAVSDGRIDAELLEIRRWHRRRSSGGRSTTRTASRSPSTGT